MLKLNVFLDGIKLIINVHPRYLYVIIDDAHLIATWKNAHLMWSHCQFLQSTFSLVPLLDIVLKHCLSIVGARNQYSNPQSNYNHSRIAEQKAPQEMRWQIQKSLNRSVCRYSQFTGPTLLSREHVHIQFPSWLTKTSQLKLDIIMNKIDTLNKLLNHKLSERRMLTQHSIFKIITY